MRNGNCAGSYAFDPSALSVMRERHEERLASARFFETTLQGSGVLDAPPNSTAAERQATKARVAEQYQWLVKFERELAAEEVRAPLLPHMSQ